MGRFWTVGVLRVAAALMAAAISIAICIKERHVRIVLSQPATYDTVFHHKCGNLMVACVGWARFELVRQIAVPEQVPEIG